MREGRFWGDTPSVAPYAMAAAGMDILLETGMQSIYTHNQRFLRGSSTRGLQAALVSHGEESVARRP